MREFIDNFIRSPDGTWICIRGSTYHAPDGLIVVRPGDRFVAGEVTKGIDLAASFDEHTGARKA